MFNTGFIYSNADSRDYHIDQFTEDYIDKAANPMECEAKYLPEHVDHQEKTNQCSTFVDAMYATCSHKKHTGEYKKFSSVFNYGYEKYRTHIGEGMTGRDSANVAYKVGFLEREDLQELCAYKRAVELVNAHIKDYTIQASAYTIDGYCKLNDAHEFKKAIELIELPQPVSLSVYTNFNDNKNGLVPYPSGSYHSPHKVLGLGVVKFKGIQCIRFINTWGSKWGDNGYGYLPVDMLREAWAYWDVPPIVRRKYIILKVGSRKAETEFGSVVFGEGEEPIFHNGRIKIPSRGPHEYFKHNVYWDRNKPEIVIISNGMTEEEMRRKIEKMP